jgi:hypothetical protein
VVRYQAALNAAIVCEQVEGIEFLEGEAPGLRLNTKKRRGSQP